MSRDGITVFFFPNGNTAVCSNGEQVPELQESWFRRYVALLEESGVDIENCEFNMPDGAKATIVRHDEGWNWRMCDRGERT